VKRFLATLAFALYVAAVSAARGQFEGDKKDQLPEHGIQLGKPMKQKWQVGVIVRALSGPCAGISGTIAVPTDWPEQEVRETAQDLSAFVKKVSYRMLDGGVRQMLFEIPQLPAGQEAKALVTFEIVKHEILPPTDTSRFVLPVRPPKDVLKLLGPSPLIESRQAKVIALAKELLSDKKDAPAWEQVEALYDGVRAKVEFREGQLQGAAAALKDGHGNREDLVSLFVAVCRASKVPARTVWVQGGCYGEFFLQDKEGQGHWIPCQPAGTKEFGGIRDQMPVLQKGDNFKAPETKEAQRFVAEFLKVGAATSKPEVRFVRNVLPAD
jgi:hypothetical protein